MKSAEAAAGKYALKNLGTVQEIIAEEYADGFTSGYTGNYIRVYVSGKLEAGKKYKVILKNIYKDGVIAELT